MSKNTIIKYIKQLDSPVFTTRGLSDISQKSPSTVTQSLNFLCRQGVVKKLYRGIWTEVTNKQISPFMLIPHLFKSNRVYVSFLSALHLHGMIEQIPQTITLASTTHTRKIKTAVGTFIVHKISPGYFFGSVIQPQNFTELHRSFFCVISVYSCGAFVIHRISQNFTES